MSRMCGGICIIFFGCCLLSARQQTAYEKKKSKLPALFNTLLRNVKDRTGKNSI